MMVSYLAFVAVMDIHSAKVKNKYILFGLLAFGIIEIGLGDMAATTYLYKCVGALFLLYPLYMLGAFGAGDVKLFSVISPVLAWNSFISMVFVSMCLAAGWGMGLVLRDMASDSRIESHKICFVPFIFISFLIETAKEFFL